jgi:hypothetical protein
MAIGKIAQAMSENARNFIYHCAMCDIEIRQSACPTQGGANCGRNVTSSRTRRPAIRSITKPKASKLVGSDKRLRIAHE